MRPPGVIFYNNLIIYYQCCTCICHGNDVKLIRCCPGHDVKTAAMLALSGVWVRLCQVESPLQEMVWLHGLLSWHVSHFWVCITFCTMPILFSQSFQYNIRIFRSDGGVLWCIWNLLFRNPKRCRIACLATEKSRLRTVPESGVTRLQSPDHLRISPKTSRGRYNNQLCLHEFWNFILINDF